MAEDKNIFFIIVVVAIVAIVGIVGIIGITNKEMSATGYVVKGIDIGGQIAGQHVSEQAWEWASEQAAFKRVIITPYGAEDIYKIKSMVDVRHEFDGKFSANVAIDSIPEIKKLADVEDINIYYIQAKPVCGDGVISPVEKCGEPGLPNCPEPQVCQNCRCVTPTTRTCYPSIQKPWGIVKVNGSSGGSGINVAVLDTGAYKEHLDLNANIKLCKDATKKGIVNGCADGNGHGTHVAGTIAANAGSDGKGIYGVAPSSNLWVMKVCGASGSCWADDIAAGIRYVTDQNANIISMSLGGDTESSLIKDAINYATAKGVLIIAAAGNDGPKPGTIDYPAANVKVIAAGAIDVNENIPDWSSRGVNDGDYIIEEKEVEFGTPGVAVESAWNDGCYKVISGTSMATPHVSGLAAKLWQGSALATRTYLQELAKNHDLYTAGDDTATGFGLPIAP